MQNQDTIFPPIPAPSSDQEPSTSNQPSGSNAPVTTTMTPGWSTSSGQMTGIFTLICLILSIFGYSKLTPDMLTTLWGGVLAIFSIVGPLLPAAWNLMNYTNSRGKIQSNLIVSANQTVQAAHFASAAASTGGSSIWTKILNGIQTGIGIEKTLAPILPIPDQAQTIINTTGGLAGQLANPTVTMESQTGISNEQRQINQAQASINAQLVQSINQLNTNVQQILVKLNS